MIIYTAEINNIDTHYFTSLEKAETFLAGYGNKMELITPMSNTSAAVYVISPAENVFGFQSFFGMIRAITVE